MCGFLGHGAHLGCSRCRKKFTGSPGGMDYSGFNRDSWEERTSAKHRENARKTQNCRTQSEQNERESETGCRYSVLLKLSYFDAPRMLVVDPMHNLFLGSAKHFLTLLIENCTITSDDFHKIQHRVDSFIVPSDVGCIPHKISSDFSSFTADQWKNWTVYFSLIVLHDILPHDLFQCWQHFVLACRILCRKQITTEQLKLGDALLLQFCRRTQRIFGNSSVTPNMHMHCHLRSCIEDYGPMHGFWFYAYERYNGIIAAMQTNNHSNEVQLMKRFLRDTKSLSTTAPSLFSDEFLPLFSNANQRGSLLDSVTASASVLPSTNWTVDSSSDRQIEAPNYSTCHTLLEIEKNYLIKLYSRMNDINELTIEISPIVLKFNYLSMYGKHLGSYKSRVSSSSTVIITWNDHLFGNPQPLKERAARVNYFCKHVASINGKSKTHILANLSWFKDHPKHSSLGSSISIWYHDIYLLIMLHIV